MIHFVSYPMHREAVRVRPACRPGQPLQRAARKAIAQRCGRARIPHGGLRSAQLRQDHSVLRNITIEEFSRTRKRHFVLFADLLGVRSVQSLARRLATSLRRSFAASFPVRSLLESASRFLGALRPEIALGPQTGSPYLSFYTGEPESARSLQTLWDHIAGIAEEVDSLIVLDEFQDVALIDEAPGQLRPCLEGLARRPYCCSVPSAPLSAWGTDLECRPIPHDEYHRYMEERFSPRRLTISREVSADLQDDMQRVPEAINRVCEIAKSSSIRNRRASSQAYGCPTARWRLR